MSTIAPFIRDLQTRAPFALAAKASVQRLARKLLKKPFEPEFSLLSRIHVNDRHVLDIGANRGQSIEAIRIFQPTAKIEAFEPNPLLADALTKRYRGDNSLRINNVGLGSQEESASLFVPFYRNFMYDGLASFSEEDATTWLNSERLWRFNPALLTIKKVPCTISTLDDFDLDPVFVKIDVQGFEREVLAGGEQMLLRAQPVILVETNGPADEWLVAKGWVRSIMHPDGALEQGPYGAINTVYFHPGNEDHRQFLG